MDVLFAKNEAGARINKSEDGGEETANALKDTGADCGFEDEQRQDKLEQQAAPYDAEVDLLFMFTHKPRKTHHDDEAE